MDINKYNQLTTTVEKAKNLLKEISTLEDLIEKIKFGEFLKTEFTYNRIATYDEGWGIEEGDSVNSVLSICQENLNFKYDEIFKENFKNAILFVLREQRDKLQKEFDDLTI